MSKHEQKERQWLQKLFQKQEPNKKKKWPLQYVLLLGCVGIALMIASNLLNKQTEDEHLTSTAFREETADEQEAFGKKQESAAEPYSMEDYEIRYENQLRETLAKIVGLNHVSVMVNLDSTEQTIYEKNISSKNQDTNETDREGGTRKVEDRTREEQVVIVRNGDKEEALLVRKEKPVIRGVLVVAQGVENVQVKANVVEAVSRVLDVPTHRVSVMPMKSEEE